jgi:hypothetical protein
MSAQLYIARLIEEGRTDRGPHATFRREDAHRAAKQRAWRLRKDHTD